MPMYSATDFNYLIWLFKMVILRDRGSSQSQRKITKEGYLITSARISRSGTQTYTALELGLTHLHPDENVVVYRPDSEVFSDVSMESFKNVPVTLGHPPDLLTSETSAQYTIGYSTGNVTRDGDYLVAELVIIDQETIENIKNGVVEISNGYEVDIVLESGQTPDGVQYDAVQRGITGNHIAILKRGRAGPNCRIADNKRGNTTMLIHLYDGTSVDVDDVHAPIVRRLNDKLADSTRDLKTAEDEKIKFKASSDAHFAALLDAEPDTKAIKDAVAVVEAGSVIGTAVKFGDCDSVSGYIKAVVADKCTVDDNESDAYYRARFDILLHDAKQGEKTSATDELNTGLVGSLKQHSESETDYVSPTVKARQARLEENRKRFINRS